MKRSQRSAAAHQVASSLDDSKVCRICLESHDHDDPFHGSRLIAPCQCRGTQGWVHRECLDRWRATREARAVSQCTECFFAYEYVARDESGEDKGLFFDGGPLTPQRRRRLKFQMFVARDFLAVFVVMQICVLFLAAVLLLSVAHVTLVFAAVLRLLRAVPVFVFALIWPPMLWRWRRLHPVALARFNGANAVKGPSGYSTTARSVGVPAEPSLATPLLSPAAS